MKVSELMTPDVVSCTPDTNLAEAAHLMWDRDCGVLPVVDTAGHVSGIITDRDICMAAATKDRVASRISCAEVMARKVHGVAPTDEVTSALKTMREHKVHRLPVIDDNGQLKGILSMNDIVLFADGEAAASDAIVDALQGICEHRKVALTA